MRSQRQRERQRWHRSKGDVVMRWVRIAIWLILFCGLWIRSIEAEPPFSGVGYCTSGQVVNGLNQNAPPHCVPNGGGGGGTNLKPYNGGVQITATPNDGSNFENGVCHDGICPATAFGIQCDGITDNNPSSSGPLQTFINAAQASITAGTGIGDIPASCNGSSGHQLVFSNPITIPNNVRIRGLGGECHTGANCVELDFSGSGTAITSTNTNGSGLENIRLKTTTGAIGLDLQGTFKFGLTGSNITGFSTNGVLIEDTSSSSALYNHLTDALINANGVNIYFDQHNSGKAVSANTLENVEAISATGAENIHFTGNANENVFKDLDMSHATTGMLCDAFSCRDTLINEVTAEGDPTIFNLGQDVQNFEAFAVDGGFFNGSNGTPILADGTATYSVCWGVLGSTADECDFQGVRRYTYLESVAFQDSTQQATLGEYGNSLLQSNAFTNAAWQNVNPGAQTITDNNATGPSSVANTASTVLFAGNSTNSLVRQSFNNGSSIQTTCFTFSESFRIDPASSGTMLPYWMIVLQDGAGGSQENRNYPLSGKWTRGSVTNCFPSSASNSVLAYGVDVAAANNTNSSLIIDIANAQLTKTAGPVGYAATTTTAVALTVGLNLANPLLLGSGGTGTNYGPANVWNQRANGAAGTTVNKLACLDSSQKLQDCTAAMAGGVLGVTDSGAGTTGSAVVLTGPADHACVFDGGVTAGDCVGLSATINGDCTDLGVCSSASGTEVGLVDQATAVGAGTYTMFFRGADVIGAGGGGGLSSLNPYTGNVGIQSNRGNGGDFLAGVKLDNGWPITAWGGFASAATQTMTTVASTGTATLSAAGDWVTAVAQKQAHGLCYGCGPATTLTTPNAPTVYGGWFVDSVIPTTPFQIAVTNCVQSIKVTQLLTTAESYIKVTSGPGRGQFSESDAAGTCTLTFTTNDVGNNIRIYYAQSTPTAGTNNFYACQQDFDGNNGSTACSAVGSLTNVANMMLTQNMPLQFGLDNATNVSRHKSIIWVQDIPDFYAGWFYRQNHYIKPSVNNAGGHYYKLTSASSVSSSTTVTNEDETGNVTFNGSTTQFTFNLANTDNISPGSLTITLGPLPAWQSTHAFAANAIIVPQSSLNNTPTNPGQHVFEVTAGGGGSSGGTQPIWCQTAGCMVTDGALTWTEEGTSGYGGLTNIHDDASGNLVGKVGLNKQITDPGTGTNTIGYLGASAGAVHINFAAAPWAGGTFTITYQHTAAPTWCQTAACTTTVGSQTWLESGTTVPTDQYYKSASAFGATALIDYWGSDAYTCDECGADGIAPVAATNGVWFFNMTALTGTTATIVGENGSDATPDSGNGSTPFTIKHDNTVPIANEISAINSAQAGNASATMVFPSNTASYNVYGQVLTNAHNSKWAGNGAQVLFTGDGVGVCSTSANNGQINMGSNSLILAGYLRLVTDNGTADTLICHGRTGSAFGTINFGDDVILATTSKGNRTTAFNSPNSFSGQWRANTNNFYRAVVMSQANGAVFSGGSVGNNPDWPGLFLAYQIAYLGNSTNDGFGPWFVFESCPNAIGPADATLDSMTATNIDQVYNSDFLGGHTTGSGVASGADSGFYLPIERATNFDLNGTFTVRQELGGSGIMTYMGGMWLRGVTTGANYNINHFSGPDGAFGIIADTGTKLIVDDTNFTNLVGGATCIEARNLIEARGNTCQQTLRSSTNNPIAAYRLGYKQDELTCNSTTETTGTSSGNVFIEMNQMNQINANLVTPIAGMPMVDVCSGTAPYYHIFTDLTQQQTLNLDTAGKVWPQILTETPFFAVTDAGTAGTTWQLPACGGSAAMPGARSCGTPDIGRAFRFWEKATNATPGATTFAAGFHTDNSCSKTLTQNQILTGEFIEQASGVWYQVGECSTTS